MFKLWIIRVSLMSFNFFSFYHLKNLLQFYLMSVEFEIESWVYYLNFFLHNTWNFFWVQTSATRFINIKTKTSLLYSTTLSFKYLFFKKYFIEQNQKLSKCFCTFSLLPIAFKLVFPWHITNNLSDFF